MAAGPLIARFLEEDDEEYLVGEPGGSRTARVPKRRAPTELYLSKQRRGSSERLLRWSSYALVGSACGGVVGIALGTLVVLAALVRLARLSSRIHRWRRRNQSSEDWQPLPAQASRERMQLYGALGQGILGILLGGAVLYFLVALI